MVKKRGPANNNGAVTNGGGRAKFTMVEDADDTSGDEAPETSSTQSQQVKHRGVKFDLKAKLTGDFGANFAGISCRIHVASDAPIAVAVHAESARSSEAGRVAAAGAHTALLHSRIIVQNAGIVPIVSDCAHC